MTADLPLMSLEDAQRLYERPGYVAGPVNVKSNAGGLISASSNEAQKARARAIVDTALSVGIKTGLAWQLHNIDAVVQKMSRDLESIYNFNGLMIKLRVVPPVIAESRNLYNQDGDYAVRLSGAQYEIVRQARFSSVAPSWREYLTFPSVGIDPSSILSMLMPKTDDEQRVWKVAVKNGYDQGVEQANIMLKQAVDRLNRDYAGMDRFHEFVLEGKVTLPAIAAEDIPVTNNGRTMAVDEKLLRITALPEFNSKLATWQPVVISTAKPQAQKASAADTSSADVAQPAMKGAPR